MRHLILAAVLVFSSTSAFAGFFRCVDAKGKTYYSDRSCTTKAATPIKSGDGVEKLTTEEAKVRGGNMSVIGAPDMTRGALADIANSADRRVARQEAQANYERQVNDKLADNYATKQKLAKDHAQTYKRLEAKSGGDMSRCTVTSDGKKMYSECAR